MLKYKLKEWIANAPRKNELIQYICKELDIKPHTLRHYWRYRKLQREKLGIAKKRKIVEAIRFHYKQCKTDVSEITLEKFAN